MDGRTLQQRLEALEREADDRDEALRQGLYVIIRWIERRQERRRMQRRQPDADPVEAVPV